MGQFLSIAGAAFQASSRGRGQYMGARFVLGFGIAFNMCAAVALLSELAIPRFRGTLVSLVGCPGLPTAQGISLLHADGI